MRQEESGSAVARLIRFDRGRNLKKRLLFTVATKLSRIGTVVATP